ncbi:hypothetical protein QL285_076152 [Trifolium repens]|nr:hypothetical protein QL285_076152 [Trifolium repens]
MCLGWVNEDHFMQIHLKLDSPIPQTIRMWDQHHLKCADSWPDRYARRMELYNNLKRAHDGIVVEDEKTSPRFKVVVGFHDEDGDFVVKPVDLSKN